MRATPSINLSDQSVNRQFDFILQTLETLTKNPLLGGVILKSVTLASGSNEVKHGLGKVLSGWFPVRLRASATLFDTQDSNPTPATTLRITASSTVIADIYVF